MDSPFIFISYSRKDEVYVKKLIHAIEDQGLTVWLDDRIDYGTTWPRVIEEHLEKCQVFILVMTSNSRESHWVQCELQHALALKKPIFPILLEGKRWLDVESIQCVDVNNGELPTNRFFERVSTALQTISINLPSETTIDNELTSEKGLNYTQLRDFLKAGKWQEADEETAKQMLQVMRRQQEGWLRVEDVEQFPCTELRTIDHLWVKYSDGQFGFSIQKKIWQQCRSLSVVEQYEKFLEQVGWKRKDWWQYFEPSYIVMYSGLTFNLTAKKGHLPILAVSTRSRGIPALAFWEMSSLSERLVNCNI